MSDLNDLNRPVPTDTEPNVLDTLRAHIIRAATWSGWGSTTNKVAGLMSAVTAAVSGGRSLRLYRRNDANTADDEVVSLPSVSVGGNAATATKLQTARSIGGVSFDGTANINLPGVNTAGNQSTTGNAATATKLQTARSIGGVSFDGTANINLPGVNAPGNQNTTGNAATATQLQTQRKINRRDFNGTADIEVTEWFHSDRDFPSGTLITTSINYAVESGEPFVLEIRGNSYGALAPFDLQYQGYIYGNTIYNHGGNSNGADISGMVALNVGGNLCFWFPNQSYWQGFNVKVYIAFNGQGQNKVTAVTNSAKPSGTKEVALNNLYRMARADGANATGTWPISISGTAAGVSTAGALNAIAGAIAGGVGTYAFAHGVTGSPGTTAAGSSLSTSNRVGTWGPTLTGTWRCMGYADVSDRSTLWLRIA